MIDSIEQITLKDGQTILVMSHADLVETIRNTLGNDFADLVEKEMTGTDRAQAQELRELEDCVREQEGIVDRCFTALQDIHEEAKSLLDKQLELPRLNRGSLKKACQNIIDIVENEI